MSEKCLIDPERDCLGLQEAKKLENDLNELRKQNSASHERIFTRLGELEKQEGIQGEQYKHIIEKLGDMTLNLSELKADSKEVIAKLPPLTHRVEALERLADDVEELKERPGETWEHIKKQGLAWAVTVILALLAAALGLSRFM